MKTTGKVIGSLAIAVMAALTILFLMWPLGLIDLVFGVGTGDLYLFKGDVRNMERKGEKLPTVTIQNGAMVYCRMYLCDFSFPLPDGAHVVRTNIDGGGGDTINGEIYVAGPTGGPVNMRAYAELLQKENFVAEPCDGSGCPEVTNRMADVPFVSNGEVIHYPLFNDFTASSKKPEGGFMEVNNENHVTKIRFSYFGDY